MLTITSLCHRGNSGPASAEVDVPADITDLLGADAATAAITDLVQKQWEFLPILERWTHVHCVIQCVSIIDGDLVVKVERLIGDAEKVNHKEVAEVVAMLKDNNTTTADAPKKKAAFKTLVKHAHD